MKVIAPYDGIIVFFALQKLDAKGRGAWELSLDDRKLPVLDTFLKFLNQRARALAAQEIANPTYSTYKEDKRVTRSNSRTVHTNYASAGSCRLCHGNHPNLWKCARFNKMTVQEKRQAVNVLNVCYNCLTDGHGLRDCKSGA